SAVTAAELQYKSLSKFCFSKGASIVKRVVALLLTFAALLAAQTPTATVTGIVKDPSGGILVGAKVSVRNVDTNIAHDLTTNKDGEYTVPLLPVGRYEVSI